MRIVNLLSARPEVARRGRERENGFSVIEMTIAILVLTVLMGAMMTFMSTMQERYTSESRLSGLNQAGKTAMDLLAIDVSQAGFPPIIIANITQAINSTGSQSVTISVISPAGALTNSGLYVGRVILVDVGANMEAVNIDAVGTGTITAQFKQSHPTPPVPVRVSAVPYPQGVVFSTTTGQDTSTCTSLKLMGDLHGDASLRYIEYRYTAPANSTTPGFLVRSDSSAFASAENAAVTVVDNLYDTTLFSYIINMSTCPTSGLPTCVTCINNPAAGSFLLNNTTPPTVVPAAYVTNVGVTMSMLTQASIERNAQAGGQRQMVIRQQYFTPRNVIAGLKLSGEGLQTILPLAPGTVVGILGQ